MRKLFLHIGLPKTGSSALQVWLSKNVELLKANDIFYPDAVDLDNYQISSGNGAKLVSAILCKRERDYLQALIAEWQGNILFSNELFATRLSQEDLFHLKKVTDELQFEVHIIVFIRDIYNEYFSDYQQMLKRGSYLSFNQDNSFYEFCEKRHRNSSFFWGAKIRLFTSLFSKYHVIHYDKEKQDGLDHPFYNILSLDKCCIPRMNKRIVNRSLNPIEIRLLQLARKEFADHFPEIDLKPFITTVSDYILNAIPEQETKLFFDNTVYQLLEKRIAKDLAKFNEEFSMNVQLINLDEKTRILDIPPISKDWDVFIQALFKGFKRMLTSKKE